MIPERGYQKSFLRRIGFFVFLLLVLHTRASEVVLSRSTQAEPQHESPAGIMIVQNSTHNGHSEGSGVIERFYSAQLHREVNARYLLYLPWHYGENDTKWPLLLYLHGGMGRGDDFDKMAWYPVPKMMLRNDSLPFVVIAPQCPAGEMWTDAELLVSLIHNICDSFAIDTNRIYLAGYSMGGAGAWFVAYEYPKVFAAIAPMSGWSMRFSANRLKLLPVWVFHGADDTLVPPSESEIMIRDLRRHDVEVRASIVAGRGHAPPTAEEHIQLFDWFLKHRRDKADSTQEKR